MSEEKEILVIGAGIHGAGAAQAAAAAGYSVAVVEKSSVASGTSSKSSKLIHGGLRYLESGQYSLVRECLRERQLLLNNAPHLVSLKPFYIPVYQHSSRSALKIRLGLSLYAILNGLHKSGVFTLVEKSRWSQLDGLSRKGLSHVFRYYDAQTDDARLTQSVMRSATSLGAELQENTTVVSTTYKDGLWWTSLQRGNQVDVVKSKILINAAGPWVNHVLDKVESKPKQIAIELVQGTHIVLNENITQGIYYVEANDKRALFVMPRQGKTLLGTTEKIFHGEPDQVSAGEDEIQYLLDSVQKYFPQFKKYSVQNIEKSFAGLRVLPAMGQSAFSRPRETMFFEDGELAPGLFTIYGGKLTAYRATAETLIGKIKNRLPERPVVADTRTLKLPDVD